MVQFMYNDQALRVSKNTMLRRIHWVEIYSFRNETNSPEMRIVMSTISLKLSNVNSELGISA